MNIVKVIVNANGHKYTIIIGTGIATKLSKILDENEVKFEKCLLVIDNKISKTFIKKIISSLSKKKLIIIFLMLMK